MKLSKKACDWGNRIKKVSFFKKEKRTGK